MNVFDLFSGIGGFSLGLQAAGMKTVAFCEIEKYAQRVLVKNFQGIPIFDDVSQITGEQLNDSGLSVDLICGGFPCQDISIAGKRAGIEKGEKSGLWREFKRLIGEVRPRYALIENVSGLLSSGLDVVLQDLAQIGYDATWTTIDSQYCGVPQRRRRVYILAVRDGIGADTDIFGFEQRNNAELREKMEAIEKSRPWSFEASGGFEHAFAYFTRQRSDQFLCAGVSSALLKRDYKDFTDVILDDGGVRRITPRERLKLQGFPEDYFDGCELNNQQSFMLTGMTVPVVEWLGHSIMNFDKSVVTAQ